MPELKLTYFFFPARAEPARMMLHYAGVPFTDRRLQMKEWPKFKSRECHPTIS